MTMILLIGALLSFSNVRLCAEEGPLKTFVDMGACPFECCQFGSWKVEKTTRAFVLPSKNSKQAGKFSAGTSVLALTGEVRTVPSKFLVKKEYGRYKPGDELWVYTYLGEGFFKVWFEGKMYKEDLGFSPYGGTPGNRCEKSEYCWGELDKDVESAWWVKIKSPDGWIGWTNQPENFSGKDGCA